MFLKSVFRSSAFSFALIAACAFFNSVGAQTATPTPKYAPTPQSLPTVTPTPVDAAAKDDPLKNLQYRQIGPFRGGRVGSVAGIADQPNVYYFGATGGGVWKTTDGGASWGNVSDGFFKTGSVGAIAVAESNPNVVYAGMGEETVRNNVSDGDGVYKSNDAGKTWKFVGLGDSRHISRVRINPKNPDIVFVAALGNLWKSSEQRGVFRSKDGGKTWAKVLFSNSDAGAEDLIFDPNNAETVYASFWRVRRTPYGFDSGGDGSAIYKSTDGGDSWTEISHNKGLPSGVLGKICLTVSPVDSNRIWATVENKDGGLYRSDDGGDNWQKVSDNPNIKQRPWYFYRLYADPINADTVYVLNVGMWKSADGGRNFTPVSTPHSDNHDLWIAPNDANRMIEANDGGANVSTNGGKTWTEQKQPTAQFYRVALDNDFPYHIYGAQQDNSTVRIASRSNDYALTEKNWDDVGGGESGWIAPLPTDSNIVFAGSYDGLLTRADRRTGQQKNVDVYPENAMGAGADVQKYRFQWSYPILFSPHQTNGIYPLYAGANVLFRSLDEGNSWQAISPDLTRNDKSKQVSSGGEITKDNTSVEYYDTIFTVAESPVSQGVIWTGSDDGLVYISKDNGANWANVTPPGMPDWIQINTIEASPFDAKTAYVAATAYKSGDDKPYLFRTNDAGKTWVKIVGGLPENSFARVIREDPNRRRFLYAGTETGIFCSPDNGAHWRSIQLNLPVVPVTDLAIHKRDQDLVVATQGRAFYVFDNLPVLYQLADAQQADAFLFKIEDAYRQSGGGGLLPKNATVGANPPNGAVVNYYLKSKPKEITIEFTDSSGKTIRQFSGKSETVPATQTGGGRMRGEEPNLPTETGFNQFVWNYRLPNATNIPGLILWGGSLAGARVVPGNYTARLTVDGKVISSENFAVKADPRMTTTAADFQKQFDLMGKINAKITATHDAILEMRDLRKQFEDLSARLKSPDQKDLRDRAAEINKKLTAVEDELNQSKIKSGQDALNFPIKLNNKLAALGASVDSSDTAPTAQSYDVEADLAAKIDVQLVRFAEIKRTDIADFNRAFAAKNLPVILTKNK